MDFFAVLDHVVDLLRSRGRVSYRALKLQLRSTMRPSKRSRTNSSTPNVWPWRRRAECWSGPGSWCDTGSRSHREPLRTVSHPTRPAR